MCDECEKDFREAVQNISEMISASVTPEATEAERDKTARLPTGLEEKLAEPYGVSCHSQGRSLYMSFPTRDYATSYATMAHRAMLAFDSPFRIAFWEIDLETEDQPDSPTNGWRVVQDTTFS